MNAPVTAGREIVVGSMLILISAPLVTVAGGLVVIRPSLILITRRLIIIRRRVILILGRFLAGHFANRALSCLPPERARRSANCSSGSGGQPVFCKHDSEFVIGGVVMDINEFLEPHLDLLPPQLAPAAGPEEPARTAPAQ
jgi:hypothetical protein